MTPLPDLLERAAGTAPVSFDHTDVRRRVERRVRRQRALTAAVILAVIGLAAGLLATAGSEDSGAKADAPGTVSRDELTGGIWTLHATSAVTARFAPAWVAFRDDGTMVGFDGCERFQGGWHLDGTELSPTEVEVVQPDLDGECLGSVELTSALAGGATVGRFDGAPGSLELRVPDGFVAFRRVDRIGRVPVAADFAGSWSVDGSDTEASFLLDGTVLLVTESCAETRTWALDGDELSITPPDEPAGCPFFPTVAGGPLEGTSAPRIETPSSRVEDDYVWLVTEAGLVTLSDVEQTSADPTVGLPGQPSEVLLDRIMVEVLEDPAATIEGDGDRATVETESGSTVVVQLAHDAATDTYRLVDLASPGLALGADGTSITSPVAGRLTVLTYDETFGGDGTAHVEVPVEAGPNEVSIPDGAWIQLVLRTDAGPTLHLLARRR